MANLLEVEVVAHVLGSMNHCSHCQVFIDGVGVGEQVHKADIDSYPPDWMEEWQRLSDLIFNITEKYAGQLVVKVIDAQSPQAIWKAIRRGVRKYPTFIIGKDKYHGLDQVKVDNLIDLHLAAQAG
jgi:hypothetical protein